MHCLACHHRVAAGALCPRCGRRAPARGATDAGPAPTVPGFDVDGLLGAGGFAVVWEARDRHSGRPVAIKVARPGAEARLAREAALLRGAVTPAFGPRWLADGRARDGRRYVAMEHAGRDRLADRMARRDRAPIAAALAEIAAVADAVAAMHAAGLVHRDLKPDNLLLRPGGRACAIDYGLARAIAEPGAPADAPHPTLTATGEALGTPHYMAPELWGGAATAGPAADVYAVAAIAYELLAGHPPFCGDPVAIRHGHATGRPPPIAAACGLPAEVDAVLAVGLAKRPGDRPESAAAFAERLAAAVRAAARTPRTGAARRAGDGRRDGAAAPRPRDPVALVALHSDAPLPRIAAVAAGAGAVVARAGDALAVLAVTAPDTPAARVRAAIALARACVDALAPAGPVVVHAAAARVAGTPRGPRVAGAAVAGAESWHAAAPDAAVAITRDAAALVDADELRPARDGYATPAGVTPPSAPPEPPPLVGCHALLDRAAAALRVLPACAVLAGGRGVGKSRALDALAGRLADAGATVVRLRARPASGADPEDLARQLARAALDLGADEPADDAALDRAWRAAGADPPPPARAALAYTLGVRGAGDPDVAAVTAAPGALRPALARALAAAVAARASRSPLAVFVDDAHHADPAVLDALDLAAGDRGAQLAVAIAADPALDDVAPRWGARAARCERLVIEPLGDRDARALLRALLRPAARVPDAALAPLCELAGGVPAHLVELARGAHARGAIRRAAAGDGWELAADRIDGGDSATAGPDRLLARVAADARRGLPAPLVGLAELCAVLGAPISPERVAAAIAHLPAGDPLHVLDPAAGIDRLVARGALRGRPPRPRSPLWTRA
ncbi:MAG: serine/threonine-protein kinase PknK, partial [Deltaproteobacteria bacterium]